MRDESAEPEGGAHRAVAAAAGAVGECIIETNGDADGSLIAEVRAAFSQARAGEGILDPAALAMRGMSGRKYRLFINNLIRSLPDPRYLEVGCFTGSTLCSAISGNSAVAVAIDNWSQFGGPKQEFLANLDCFRSADTQVRIIDGDFREVDFASLDQFNVYLFDGPHREQDHFDGIVLAQPALQERYVLIVDDWNWERVRKGTLRAIEFLSLVTRYSIQLRTTMDGSHGPAYGPKGDWHNGYFIAVIEKPSTALS